MLYSNAVVSDDVSFLPWDSQVQTESERNFTLRALNWAWKILQKGVVCLAIFQTVVNITGLLNSNIHVIHSYRSFYINSLKKNLNLKFVLIKIYIFKVLPFYILKFYVIKFYNNLQ